MLIPSIDLQGGQAVQLVQGRRKVLEAGDPRPLLRKFSRLGEVAVIDLDAAMGTGSNAELITELVQLGPCRVGGGIRDAGAALDWLDRGAARVILGTAARPEVLKNLPRERVIVALDAWQDEVVVEGWQKGTGRTVLDRLAEVRDLAGGLLVTFVEGEGKLQGLDLERVPPLVDAARGMQVTIAGGVTTARDIAGLDRLAADAQVGMAIYTGQLDVAEAFAAPLVSDRPDGLWPTVVADESGRCLGLTYSSPESLRAAIHEGAGVYWSRRRGLWRKGASSGRTQELLRVDADCDRDCLRFTVRQQEPGFCHLDTATCWGEQRGLPGLTRRLAARSKSSPAGSYTRRLLDEPELLGAKLVEEAAELAAAATPEEVVWEAADLLYFTLTAMTRAGASLDQVEQELDRRARLVTRRPGDAKTGRGGN
jgi:phosphoribosyl-ATP pyrophosphohydrolase/phosphoribosyl-AMP cyclohydrolase